MGPDDLNDIEIELEEVTPDFVPPGDEEIEAPHREQAIAPALPEGDEDDEPAPRAPRMAADEDDDDDVASSAHARIAAAEARTRETEAYALLREADYEAKLAGWQKSQIEVNLTFAAKEIDSRYAALATARDNGDTAAEIQITREIREAESIRSQLEAARANLPNPDSIVAQARQRAQGILHAPTSSATAVGAGITASSPLAVQWANSNGWMKSNATANQFVIKQSEAMVKEGWAPEKRSFYAELSKRVNAQYPQLKAQPLQAKKGVVQTRRGAVAPARSASAAAGQTQKATGSRYTLTAAEQATMKRFKLDPKNPEHQKSWARSRMESARTNVN